MQTSEADTNSSHNTQRDETIRIWIEDGEGAIARGQVEALLKKGALVRLIGAVAFSGSDVVVRVAFSQSLPTLGGAAHVRWIRQADAASECELEWTHSGPEREQLARLSISLGA